MAVFRVQPEFAATVQNRPDTLTGVDPVAIGPMFLEEPTQPEDLETLAWLGEAYLAVGKTADAKKEAREQLKNAEELAAKSGH